MSVSHTIQSPLPYRLLCCKLVCMPALQSFPAIYEEPVIRHIHHSTHKLDDLASRIAAHFRDSFVCGEEVVGTKDGTPMACRVIAVHEAPPVEGLLHMHQALLLCLAWLCCATALQLLPDALHTVLSMLCLCSAGALLGTDVLYCKSCRLCCACHACSVHQQGCRTAFRVD